MKHYFFFVIFSVLLGSCSFKNSSTFIVNDKMYESKRGPLYHGNKLFFKSDGSFIYIGQGPSVFLSKGTWKYNSANKEILFTSQAPDKQFIKRISVDTLWVDISNRRAKVMSKKKLVFDNIIYYRQ